MLTVNILLSSLFIAAIATSLATRTETRIENNCTSSSYTPPYKNSTTNSSNPTYEYLIKPHFQCLIVDKNSHGQPEQHGSNNIKPIIKESHIYSDRPDNINIKFRSPIWRRSLYTHPAVPDYQSDPLIQRILELLHAEEQYALNHIVQEAINEPYKAQHSEEHVIKEPVFSLFPCVNCQRFEKPNGKYPLEPVDQPNCTAEHLQNDVQ